MFHVVCWGISLCFSVIPIPGHHYGSAGVWCWIKGQTSYENGLRFGCFYMWVWFCILIEIVCFALVVIRVRRQLKIFQNMSDPNVDELEYQYKKYIYPLLLYPLVNFILAIPVTANRIQNWVDRENPIFGLYLCHSIVYPLWGFCNAMMYFMSKETILQLHPCNVCERLISWRRSSPQDRETSSAPKLPDIIDHNYAANVLTNPAGTVFSTTMDTGSDME